MSTQQIPSTAQIAAARSALWHQNTPEPDLTPEFALSVDVGAAGEAQSASIPTPASAEQPASPEPTMLQGETDQGADHGALSEGNQAASEHSGIDVTDPEATPPRPPTGSRTAASVAILTQSGARDFLNQVGLLLFTAKPQFAGIPAPTFVEATLGVANANPSLPAAESARTLLARLIADGSAVPLNLLGLPATTAEAPDFIVSAAAFPYIFTLRGDKAWKQPPSTSGATKVSPLAANTYTLLVEDGPQSSYDLVGMLGKEITEAAVLRALSELWQQLRVLPVPQPGNKPTLWEPITTRFTKQIKTGANAGQPTALSTFISLYLGQCILATEDEIETFLSPLAPRSRVRDVIHALSGARQLETITIEGKHHLHIAGDLPLFEPARHAQENDDRPVLSEDGSRIKKFVPQPRKLGTGSADRPKPFRSPADRTRPKGSSDSRAPDGRSSERFTGASVRPTFNKPWDEEKEARTERIVASQSDSPSEYQDIDLDADARPKPPRPFASRPSFGDKTAYSRKPDFGGKPTFGDRPRSGGDRPAGHRDRTGGDRPAFNRDRPTGNRPDFSRDRPGSDPSGSDRPHRPGGGDRFQPRDSRRDFTPHPSAGVDSRSPRQFGSKPSFSRKPFDAERATDDRERRPFRRDNGAQSSESSRPTRRTFGSGPRADNPRSGAGDSRPPFAGKPRFNRDRDTDSGSSRPPFRKFDAPRTPRPPQDGDSSRPPGRSFAGNGAPPRGDSYAGARSFGSKPSRQREGSDNAPRRDGFKPRGDAGNVPRREGTFSPRREGSAPPRREGGFAGKREGSFSGGAGGFPGKRPFTARPSSSAGAGKPFKKPFSRSSPDVPGASTFEKFKGNAKPWGKRPPPRKYKPKEDEA